MITRGKLQGDVLLMLNKTAKTKGFYTNERLDMGIRMVTDMVSTEMFVGGNGFADKINFITVPPNSVAVPIPNDVCYINQLRYLIGNVYEPCIFSQEREKSQWTNNNAGAQLYPSTYRIVDNCFYFNPCILEGGDNFLMLECTVWPKIPQNPTDTFDLNINQAMYWFMVHACASFCVNQSGQAYPDWNDLQTYWYDKLKETIQRRNNSAQRIRDFG